MNSLLNFLKITTAKNKNVPLLKIIEEELKTFPGNFN